MTPAHPARTLPERPGNQDLKDRRRRSHGPAIRRPAALYPDGVTEGPSTSATGPAGARTGLRASLTAAGLAAATALGGALLWGLAAAALDRQFLAAALLIGIGAGSCVARWRPGHWPTIAAGTALTLCGCALGTLLAVVFVLLGRHNLATVLAHLGAVARIYPSAVGWLGLVFWVAAAVVAGGIPLLRQRGTARAVTAAEPAEP